jgi:hypothetical protein
MVSCLLESRVGAVVDKTVTNRRFDVAPFIFDNIRARIRSARISHIRFGHSIMCRAGFAPDSNGTNP